MSGYTGQFVRKCPDIQGKLPTPGHTEDIVRNCPDAMCVCPDTQEALSENVRIDRRHFPQLLRQDRSERKLRFSLP